MESRYSVRQTADMTGVKPYVLRYWEDELGIMIQRNEMGHRYYTGYDIQLFLNIKELKKKGLQLRAVKDLLPDIMEKIRTENLKNQIGGEVCQENGQAPQESMKRLQDMKNVLCEELKEEQENTENGNEEHKILEFQSILERLILRELSSRDEEEEKCRSLDMAIRRQQIVRREAAAASEKKNGRKKIHKEKSASGKEKVE